MSTFRSVLVPQVSLTASSLVCLFTWVAYVVLLVTLCLANSVAGASISSGRKLPFAHLGTKREHGESITSGSDPIGRWKARRSVIVIGFMGGRVRPGDPQHAESLFVEQLQKMFPQSVNALLFANREATAALLAVFRLLDHNQDGNLTSEEKREARIVIFGHSWGASETVTLAGKLNALGIPVLLTAQVDSVRKAGENDAEIPANVAEAVNFYQAEGLLHGRTAIRAASPNRTAILGNYQLGYKRSLIDCAGYPWYARLFMKKHIQIEEDPRVWNKIRSLVEQFAAEDPRTSRR